MQDLVNTFQRFEECIAPEAQEFLNEKIDGEPAVPKKQRTKGRRATTL
jgi:hypothetical protein